MKYLVVKLIKGYAVQNTKTMTITYTTSSKVDAERMMNKLNNWGL
jgi:hypothetical protein